MSPQTLRKAATHLKRSATPLAGIVHRVGPCRIHFTEPTFPALVRCIVYQAACGRPGVTPRAVLRLGPDGLRAAGISGQKASYLLDLAEHTAARRLNFARLPELPDDEVTARLTQVKGIGEWTSHIFLMFSLQRPDILPVGDYGIRAAMQKLYGLDALPKPAEMQEIAQPWRPWCTVASWYLWRSLELPAE
jgi:DNA-3-methyladenine glycosylase II